MPFALPAPGRPDHQPRAHSVRRRDSAGSTRLAIEVVEGDLLDQQVDAIVNAWNRNIVPWWLLIPQGVSGAIKRRAGTAPFRELARSGPLSLGEARLTGAGQLSHRAIIHVAGINLLWRASERSVRLSVHNALELAARQGFASIALPTIGAGTGGLSEERVIELIRDEAANASFRGRVVVVRFRPG